MEERNAKKNAEIIAAMVKDKLIDPDHKNISFKIGNEGFYINGVKQPDAIFEKYKQTHIPKSSQNGEWSWTYSKVDNSK